MAAMSVMPMIEVACPHCATSWALPRARVGPGGAWVRCARCEGSFEWRRARDTAGSRRAPGGDPPEARAQHEPSVLRAAPPLDERAARPRDTPDVPPDDETVATVDSWSRSDLDTWLDDAVPAMAPSNAVAELDPSDVTPDLVARLAVEELVSMRAEELLGAYDRGTLFADFGPALTEAWSQCRARLGAQADPAAFRSALLARLGIDLPAWENRG